MKSLLKVVKVENCHMLYFPWGPVTNSWHAFSILVIHFVEIAHIYLH
jgi:hypothetical protein